MTGDQKGPDAYDLPNTHFFSLEAQRSLQFEIEKELPTGHYARKNLSYLFAISQGADCIYETDDDNMPNEHWKVRSDKIESALVIPEADRWVNIYNYFSDSNIWPRGLPLNKITITPARDDKIGRNITKSNSTRTRQQRARCRCDLALSV